MSRFEHRVERGLSRIAEQVTPSSDAWEAIQNRIVGQADQPEMEIIMLQESQPVTRRVGAKVLGAAAAIVALIVGIIVLSGGDEEGSGVDVTEQPDDGTEPFDEGPTDVDGSANETTEESTEPDTVTGAGSQWDFRITHIDIDVPGSVASNDEFAWVPSSSPSVLTKIDLSTNTVVTTSPIPDGATHASFAFGSIWIAHDDATVSRFDPATETVVETFSLDGFSRWIEPGPDTVWVGGAGGFTAYAIDPATNTLTPIEIGVRTIKVEHHEHGIWFSGTDGIYLVDPETTTVTTKIETGLEPGGSLAASPDALWMAATNKVVRIDLDTYSVDTTIDMREAIDRTLSVNDVHFAGGTLWVRYNTSAGAGIARIDPNTNEVVASKDLQEVWRSVAPALSSGPGSVWTIDGNTVTRMGHDN